MKNWAIGILCLFWAVSVCGQTVHTVPERPVRAWPQVLQEFYQHKRQAAAAQARTHRQRYNARAFATYPRILRSDVLPGVPGYEQPGALFTQALAEMYDQLVRAPAASAGAAAQHMLQQLVLHPRRADVQQETVFPAEQDPGYAAFYLSSFYIQLQDFYDYVQQAQKEAVVPAQLAGYRPEVFRRRQQEIESFIRRFDGQAFDFMHRVLGPLQTQSIPQADAAAYVDQFLAAAGPLPVPAQDLRRVLLQDVPDAAACYAQAEKLEPSFQDKVISLRKIFSVDGHARGEDFVRALGLLDYVSAGLLVQRLQQYGHVPSHREVVDEVASSIAASALNRHIAQVAQELIEFEKAFYYSLHSFHGAEAGLAAHWHTLATAPDTQAYPLAQLACAAILDSGRRSGQDGALARALAGRRIRDNQAFYHKIMPLAIDIGAGEAVMALAGPVFTGVQAAKQARTEKLAQELMASWQEASHKLQAATRLEQTAQGAAQTGRAVQLSAQEAKAWLLQTRRITRLGDDALTHAVWGMKNERGQLFAVLKVGTKEEILRTKQVDKILRKITSKLSEIELQYPRVMAEGFGPLPEFVRNQVLAELEENAFVIREFVARVQEPFVLSPVDASGFRLADTMHSFRSPGISIKQAEWDEIKSVVEALNKEGFNHGDLYHNLFIKRLPNGKLRVTLLDFESSGSAAAADHLILYEWETLLHIWGALN